MKEFEKTCKYENISLDRGMRSPSGLPEEVIVQIRSHPTKYQEGGSRKVGVSVLYSNHDIYC